MASMDQDTFHAEVEDLLSDCTLSEQEIVAQVDLRKMKTITAYAGYAVGKTYQSARKLWQVPAAGGSIHAQMVAQEVSNMLSLDEALHSMLHPSVVRLAGKL